MDMPENVLKKKEKESSVRTLVVHGCVSEEVRGPVGRPQHVLVGHVVDQCLERPRPLIEGHEPLGLDAPLALHLADHEHRIAAHAQCRDFEVNGGLGGG